MKKIMGLILVIALISSSMAFAGGWFNGASDWAEEELLNSVENKIINYDDFNQQGYGYGENISRESFAMLEVRLYKSMTGTTPEKASIDTFSDTTNSDVLMANKLGIINGKGNGIFAPYDKITRQEMAIMMKRTLDSIGIDYYEGDGVLTFSDKDSVDSWAVQGVDFAFDNGFMKGDGVNFGPLSNATIEQAVIIVNRVFEKYYDETNKIDDYTNGYQLNINEKNLYITYNNTSNKELIVENVIKADYLENDNSNTYYIGTNGLIYRYNLEGKYPTYVKDTKNATNFILVQKGTYEGHMIYKCEDQGTTYKIIKLNDAYNAEYIGDAESMDDPNYEIGESYEQIENDKYKFTIDVTDAINFQGLTHWGEDEMLFYSHASHYDYIDNKEGYLRMSPLDYDKDDYCAPMGIIGDSTSVLGYNGYGGLYKTEITFNDNENGNVGIVFNVKYSTDGVDDFAGYYAGISPGSNTVILRKASYGKWDKLATEDLGYDIESGDKVTLLVQKNGSEINVSVNGKKYISVTDNTYSESGTFGVRTWKCDATYSNYTVSPLPY